MNVSGTREFAAPRQAVWDVLNDPEELAGLMPGVTSFELQDDRHWTAHVRVPLGVGGLKLTFHFEKTEERPIDFAALEAKGKGVGAVVNLATEFSLADKDDGGTTMDWNADVHVLGQIGSMGQRVLQPIVNSQVENVFGALEERVEARASGA